VFKLFIVSDRVYRLRKVVAQTCGLSFILLFASLVTEAFVLILNYFLTVVSSRLVRIYLGEMLRHY